MNIDAKITINSENFQLFKGNKYNNDELQALEYFEEHDYTLILKTCDNKYQPIEYVLAWNTNIIENCITWSQGHYFTTIHSVVRYLSKK